MGATLVQAAPMTLRDYELDATEHTHGPEERQKANDAYVH